MIGPAALAFIGQGVNTGGNLISTLITNKRNERLMREAWDREDTAVQRRKADLLAAGMNPVLAAGQAATSSAPIRLEAPEINADLTAGLRAKTEAVQYAKTQAELSRIAIDRLIMQERLYDMEQQNAWKWKEIPGLDYNESMKLPIGAMDLYNKARKGGLVNELTGTNIEQAVLDLKLGQQFAASSQFLKILQAILGLAGGVKGLVP